ncbi:MAG: hypothetical protein IPG93_20670 [Burkholderiales bacterium]|nr:hypothetical protein [Burkholderiales bacterium]
MSTLTRPSAWLAGLVVAALLLTGAAPAMADTVLAAQVDEPRAYGWRVGDVVRRVVHLQLPPGWQLDERSLPKPDQRGGELELRALRLVVDDQPRADAGDDGGGNSDGPSTAATVLVAGGALAGDGAEHDEIGAAPGGGSPSGPPEASATGWHAVLGQGWAGSAAALWQRVVSIGRMGVSGRDGAAPTPGLRQAPRQRLELDYQLFAATTTARKLELPTLTLLVEPPAGLAGAMPRELRLPARPLWLVSLAGGAPGHQSGLGEMRPDVAVQGLPTAAPARHLLASLLVAAALLLLAVGAAALMRRLGVTMRSRPFTQASRDIRRLVTQRPGSLARSQGDVEAQAWRLLHQAFDHSAGRTLLPRQVRAWAQGDARYAGLADEIGRFFDASAERFFAIAAVAAPAGSAGVAGAGAPVSTSAGSGAGRPALPSGLSTRPGERAVAAAANDDHGFGEARLLRLARALARAEAAGLATQGARRAGTWWRRHGTAQDACGGGGGGGAGRPGVRADEATPGRPNSSRAARRADDVSRRPGAADD